ncbi:DNA mismatch repair endonuclease MutL [Clostridium sp. ATCC 25772]|uniref:DNA mismatch repair endonuclease MutL n=1 Tax=Clostridium sp. ATCC 25772 TaxID=1676991 RepID=UPI0007832B47|nr:DNA mismatch repair endonuclease MutL [Clostridium sp. ATCC 25772]
MKRINVLDKATTNKIAAGEVVERASSVVKELIENSIDANSGNITIEIEDSGNKLIRISDDGHGIYKEDIEKAFMPHATSKIKELDDIYKINSFGFRGEALASIAAVSKVKLKSKTKEDDFGVEIIINGGEKKSLLDAPSNDGTLIEVKDLFYNVPARQKFLKSPQRESSLISDLVLRLALANYGVSFKLINNGKNVITTYGTENIEDTIRILYGKQVSENIISFESHNDIASVYGYIGNSEISRGSRNRQSIFVNKRLIKSSTITAAVENAFKSFLTVNKFPFFVLFLDIFPEYIDPNVHPSKAEIKFYDERSIFKLVFNTVHEALREYLRESFEVDEEVALKELEKVEEIPKSEYKQESIHKDFFQNNIDLNKIKFETLPVDLKSSDIATYMIKEDKEEFKRGTDLSPYTTNTEDKIETVNANYVKYNEEMKLKKSIPIIKEELISKFPPIRIIGQFNNTYVVGECNKELILIDQHAAHEKYLFEKYKKSIENLSVVSQLLITPIILELSFDEYPYYQENKEVFIKAGFNIEEFGNNTISIREVPMFLGKPDFKTLFYDILDDLKNMGTGSTIDIKYNKIATLACKAAVKANDKLTIKEMEKLLEDLRYMDDPFTCPHGRPTTIKMTLTEIEKKFKRIQ